MEKGGGPSAAQLAGCNATPAAIRQRPRRFDRIARRIENSGCGA